MRLSQQERQKREEEKELKLQLKKQKEQDRLANILLYEKKHLAQGKKFIGGCDEVGRGCLAGPVVVTCCIMPLDNIIEGVNDSKKLTQKKREELAEKIKEVAIKISTTYIDAEIIDDINILEATRKAMSNSINNCKPDVCLVDAVQNIDTDVYCESIIQGDMKSYSIACASIIAKVSRDAYMSDMDKYFPGYNFSKHKGYGTKEHIQNLKKLGACKLHRKTFIGHFVDIGEK